MLKVASKCCIHLSLVFMNGISSFIVETLSHFLIHHSLCYVPLSIHTLYNERTQQFPTWAGMAITQNIDIHRLLCDYKQKTSCIEISGCPFEIFVVTLYRIEPSNLNVQLENICHITSLLPSMVLMVLFVLAMNTSWFHEILENRPSLTFSLKHLPFHSHIGDS